MGLPSVTVPVLSRIKHVNFPALCKASPLRINTPICAARPTATMTDIGVAKPNAQGHAITKTVIDVTKAKLIEGSGPKLYQIIKVKIEIQTTTGTKILEILSASFAISGLLPCAVRTLLII